MLDRYTLAGTVAPHLFEAASMDTLELPFEGTPHAQAGTYPLSLTVTDFP